MNPTRNAYSPVQFPRTNHRCSIEHCCLKRSARLASSDCLADEFLHIDHGIGLIVGTLIHPKKLAGTDSNRNSLLCSCLKCVFPQWLQFRQWCVAELLRHGPEIDGAKRGSVFQKPYTAVRESVI
jgi:hypothetical protein